jgi:hypothetical protein
MKWSRAAFVAIVAVSLFAACNRESNPTVETGPTSTGVIAGARFEVTGTATAVAADAAVTQPIMTPFTITVAERGVGGAEIAGATQNGKPVQINWEGGQPLPIRASGGGLNLNAVTVRMDEKHIVWTLDDLARDFLPGSYTLGSSVAVGAGGLARPVDGATFVAGESTTLSTSGNAVISEDPRALRLEGSNSLLVIEGNLTLAGSDGDRKVRRVNFGPGAYEITITPAAGGYTVAARLEGRVVA